MITKTVGSGGDYATLDLAAAALFTAGSLTDNTTWTIISNQTVSSWPGTYAFDPNGFTLTITDASDHAGWVLSGNIITTSVSMRFLLQAPSGTKVGGVIVENLAIINTSNSAAIYALVIEKANTYGVFTSGIRKTSVKCNGVSSACGISMQSSYNDVNWFIYDCKVYGGTTGISTSAAFAPIELQATIENCSVIGSGTGIRVSAGDWKATNCFANTFSYAGSPDYTLVTYCGSSDTSLPVEQGNVESLVSANEFISTDPASADFLKLKRTGTIYRLGTTPTLTSTDIAGKAIPDIFGNYPIGCHVGERTGLPIGITCGFLNIGDSRQ